VISLTKDVFGYANKEKIETINQILAEYEDYE